MLSTDGELAQSIKGLSRAAPLLQYSRSKTIILQGKGGLSSKASSHVDQDINHPKRAVEGCVCCEIQSGALEDCHRSHACVFGKITGTTPSLGAAKATHPLGSNFLHNSRVSFRRPRRSWPKNLQR